MLASLACLAFCLVNLHTININFASNSKLSHRKKYLIASGAPLLTRSALILMVMSIGSSATLLRDVLFTYVTTGLIAVTAFSVFLVIKNKTSSLNEQLINYYLPTILIALVMHLVFVNHIPALDYLSWLCFVSLVSVATYLISISDKERSIYVKCLTLSQSNAQSGWLVLPFAIISLISAFLVGRYADTSWLSGSLLGFMFAGALFAPEVVMVTDFLKQDKVQSAFIVMLDAALSSVLVIIPIVSLAVYFLDIENITSFTDRQTLLTVVVFAAVYFTHRIKDLGSLQASMLIGLTAVVIYLSAFI